jgi:group I intron endonuclease
MGYIYKIVNKVTNKIYIGQTTTDLKERWKGHCKSSSKCLYLKNAINKYGKENFELKLICICFDSDLNNYEKEYIKKYDCVVPNGYNLKYGGENGGKHSDIVKQKISESLKKTFNSPSFVKVKPQLGKPHTDEVKQKISNSLKGNNLLHEHLKLIHEKRQKKVYQYDLNNNLINVFNSCKDAGIELGVSKTLISKVCNGKNKTCKGFILKFE